MATLVNRECWYTTSGILIHGRVVEQSFDPDICTILADDGHRFGAPTILLALSLSEAIDRCDDNEEYWKYQANKLRSQEVENG